MSYGREDAYRERIAEMQTELRRLQFQNAHMLDSLRLIASANSRGFDVHYCQGCAEATIRTVDGRP